MDRCFALCGLGIEHVHGKVAGDTIQAIEAARAATGFDVTLEDSDRAHGWVPSEGKFGLTQDATDKELAEQAKWDLQTDEGKRRIASAVYHRMLEMARANPEETWSTLLWLPSGDPGKFWEAK